MNKILKIIAIVLIAVGLIAAAKSTLENKVDNIEKIVIAQQAIIESQSVIIQYITRGEIFIRNNSNLNIEGATNNGTGSDMTGRAIKISCVTFITFPSDPIPNSIVIPIGSTLIIGKSTSQIQIDFAVQDAFGVLITNGKVKCIQPTSSQDGL